jgi:hypothetical protein
VFETAFRHSRFVWMSKPHVSVVLIYFGSHRSTSLSYVNLATLTGYAAYPRSPQSQVVLHRTKEAGDLPRLQANTFDVLFGRHSAESTVSLLHIWKKSDRSGLVFRLGGSNHEVEDPSYLFDTVTVFPKMWS